MPGRKVPLFSKVAQDWLKHKKANVRASSWDMYRGHLDHHFGDVDSIKVNRITPAREEAFIGDKQQDGMNLTTLRKLIVTFNQVMKYAVRHKYIDHNPVTDAERPKDQGEARENDIVVLLPEQVTALFDAVTNSKYETLFMLAVLGGLREGEILGSKWADIDWDKWFPCGRSALALGPGGPVGARSGGETAA